MKIAGFEYAEGARFQKGDHPDADIVGRHLEHLRAREKGELTPADLVADARSHNSPLHSFFEWDDTAAAEAYRLTQARRLIRTIVAVYVREDKPALRTRAYTHIAEGPTSHYRETTAALAFTPTRAKVLARAWEEFSAWRQRYQDLQELSGLFEAADAVAAKLADELKD